MRHQFSILALSALCLAEQQQPLGEKLKGWWDKAAAYVPSNPPSVPDPIAVATAKVAESAVASINRQNWQQHLKAGIPKPHGEPDEWLVYVYGGNKTCYGTCDNSTAAWNTAATALTILPHPPHLGSIDCEADAAFCIMIGAQAPAIYHMLFPHEAGAEPVLRHIPLNTTTVTASEISEIHSKKTYEETEPYTGLFNPFTGLFAKTGLNVPIGYVLGLFANLPPWAPMILISLFSRVMMNRSRPQQRDFQRPPPEGENAEGEDSKEEKKEK